MIEGTYIAFALNIRYEDGCKSVNPPKPDANEPAKEKGKQNANRNSEHRFGIFARGRKITSSPTENYNNNNNNNGKAVPVLNYLITAT
jgi:hypothetical protein